MWFGKGIFIFSVDYGEVVRGKVRRNKAKLIFIITRYGSVRRCAVRRGKVRFHISFSAAWFCQFRRCTVRVSYSGMDWQISARSVEAYARQGRFK